MSHPLRIAFGALLAFSQAGVEAASLGYLEQQRSASVHAVVSVLDFGHGILQSQTGDDASSAAPGDFGPFTAGVSISNLSVSDGNANAGADGQASHISTLAADGIRYAGDAWMYAAGSSGFLSTASVSALAESLLSVRFVLDADATARLSMDSSANGGFAFLLRDAAGAVVWDQTNLYSPATGLQFTFEVLLPLTAGEYRLETSLQAYGSYDNDTGYSGSTFGSFALTLPAAIFEPHPAALLAAGVPALLWRTRRPPTLTTPQPAAT